MSAKRIKRCWRFSEKEINLLVNLADELEITQTQMIVKALMLYKKLLNEGRIKVKK